jgi:hypothetical protein
MNLGQLRELTKYLPDDTPIFKAVTDHALVFPDIDVSYVLKEPHNTYTYWYEDAIETLPASVTVGICIC